MVQTETPRLIRSGASSYLPDSAGCWSPETWTYGIAAVFGQPPFAYRWCVERVLAILGYSSDVFCIPAERSPTIAGDIVMELAETWAGLFCRHDDANPNFAADALPRPRALAFWALPSQVAPRMGLACVGLHSREDELEPLLED